MKYIFYLIIFLAIASIAFNATKLNFNGLFEGESQIGVISIVAALCVVILMSIMLVSIKIKNDYDNR